MLDTLEWLSKYGLIDIFFGLGVVSIIARLVYKVLPSNYDHLHIDASIGGKVSIPRVGEVEHSFSVSIRNSGQSNLYIARAYFRPRFRRWWSLWLKRTNTSLKVHPQSYRIANKDAFEVKFSSNNSGFTEYETLVKPGDSRSGVTTWLPLSEAVAQENINKRRCGILYVEYATQGKQGVHKVKL